MGTPVTITVHNAPLHDIDPRLFGQFMEKGADETGPEFGMQKKGKRLQSDVVTKLKQMQIPLIRFPGGAALEYANTLNLADMVDNTPDSRESQGRTMLAKGVANRFGYDEFLLLCEQLGSQALLVVNMSAALLGKKSIEEGARDAAALVAYVNARQIARLPSDMPNWPTVRAANGHPRPYGVQHFQLGNELWLFVEPLRKQGMNDAQIVTRYIDCYRACMTAMRAIDPSVSIIIDGQIEHFAGLAGFTALIREELGDQVNFLAWHHYVPGEIDTISIGEHPVASPRDIPDAQWWNACVAAPDIDPRSAQSALADDPAMLAAQRAGYRLAATEWNWNGWWSARFSDPPPLPELAKGLGAAGFLHALMRRGDLFSIACQSILVGHVWDIPAIRLQQQGTGGKRTPSFSATGLVAMLYARNHGDTLLDLTVDNAGTYSQPLRLGALRPHECVAQIDVCATRTRNRVYVHCINRTLAADIDVLINLDSLEGRFGALATRTTINGSSTGQEALTFTSTRVRLEGRAIAATLAAHSVSCIAVDIHQRDEQDNAP